jgi:hypothetical protein
MWQNMQRLMQSLHVLPAVAAAANLALLAEAVCD